jgi:hypothetical protein
MVGGLSVFTAFKGRLLTRSGRSDASDRKQTDRHNRMISGRMSFTDLSKDRFGGLCSVRSHHRDEDRREYTGIVEEWSLVVII